MSEREAIVSEQVEALEARTPFRFPREMVIALALLAVAWEIASFFVPPFVIPGWERIFKEAVASGRLVYEVLPAWEGERTVIWDMFKVAVDSGYIPKLPDDGIIYKP